MATPLETAQPQPLPTTTSESPAVAASTSTPVATTPLALASSMVLTASTVTASRVGWWSSNSLYTKWFLCGCGILVKPHSEFLLVVVFGWLIHTSAWDKENRFFGMKMELQV